MTASRAAVTVRALTKRYEFVPAVEDVSFTVTPGTVTALAGPAGSGKTTVLRVLLGFTPPDAGSATIGVPGPVGAVLSPRGLHPARAAVDHLDVYAAAAGVRRGRVAEVLAAVGLTDQARTRAGELSFGQQTRLALATALLPDPRLLLLDDAVEGLDAAERGRLHDVVRAHARRGGAAVLTSTTLSSVVSTADQLVVLSEGSVVYLGTPAKLRRGNPDRLIVAAPVQVALATALAARGFTDAVIRPDGRLAVAEATEAQIREVASAAGVRVDGIVADPIHPDRVLASLTKPRTTTPLNAPPSYVPPPSFAPPSVGSPSVSPSVLSPQPSPYSAPMRPPPVHAPSVPQGMPPQGMPR
ncbi:ATP-binding cassette domain-containing protein [Nocardia shimofusensis]|uniref:ATP-binding cassette domain-containing protein n=1 Tax=Nocardia shimofusensis TaxID=228596 RepID=UPI0009FC58AE|nr:ABC transporter ATP-binding protein [Nocardia shimofusensis]